MSRQDVTMLPCMSVCQQKYTVTRGRNSFVSEQRPQALKPFSMGGPEPPTQTSTAYRWYVTSLQRKLEKPLRCRV